MRHFRYPHKKRAKISRLLAVAFGWQMERRQSMREVDELDVSSTFSQTPTSSSSGLQFEHHRAGISDARILIANFIEHDDEAGARAIFLGPLVDDVIVMHRTTDKNREAFLAAAETGDAQRVSQMLDDEQVSPNVQNDEGQTALMLAARHSRGSSNLRTVWALLEHVALDPNIQDRYGWTALMEAARNSSGESSLETVNALLAHERIDPNVKNNNGYTAAMLAARYSTEESSLKAVQAILAHPRHGEDAKTNHRLDEFMKNYRRRAPPTPEPQPPGIIHTLREGIKSTRERLKKRRFIR